MKKKNVVVFGGGTGLSVLLRGLKTFPVSITAIVTVADDGGSSGRLRKELDIPPPGDVRNVLVALSEVEPLLEQLFQHRFENGNGLSGHSLGNLLLAGMTSITGDFARGISEMSKVLNVRGKVLPASNRSIILHGEMEDGTIVTGESSIPKAGKKIKRVFLTPKDTKPLREGLEAIRKADVIVIGPGSLYTSVLPNLLVPGICEAIKQSTARKVYICNVMTQNGETDGYTASDHLQAIMDHCGVGIVDDILVHGEPISDTVKAKYAKEKAEPVIVDEHKLKALGVGTISDYFVLEQDDVLRHNASKVSEAILEGKPRTSSSIQ
ncbi:uridine diphosphate-N-acetylglucosamine-binding protein YvcK [Halalkalibacterium halodurans]|uniref:Gluconeogenesis factor n=6 Tax=Halalkalibacterium halodurans TaxID=86665 RepID=GNGF_HALH5|nr:uridine diphosphate-N-acetylglucosamine-binding protein YvcK [Halalkalibacterium halodurans]Q9K706.1 RecName: Full=Gluconeogenesis factor [Halalkalibacterium halodurans C-125]MDY7224046.1 uridine diphosphate-N-acetylglucosamine-binding protein YvcK [Halalkalibacterium halodurans]MDY7243331.1 uridine diphosphate-N-acetylglucosamine-binding protein YvcK [Halalkalibacterium halodurans]MED4080195.1 uridine diphosphate-N-acetylglucosamine-binding protein YvcK [Halalkalibacterium halodurans]MED40